jgi:hypothetical protein
MKSAAAGGRGGAREQIKEGSDYFFFAAFFAVFLAGAFLAAGLAAPFLAPLAAGIVRTSPDKWDESSISRRSRFVY